MAQKSRKMKFTGLDGKEYGLNLNQMEFVEKYIANGYNATQAYLDVYDTNNHKTAESAAHRLLKKPGVNEYVEVRRKEYFDSLAIDAKRIIEELAKVGFVPVESKYVPPSVKTQALDKLAKIYGLYETKKEEKPQEIHIRIEE